MAGEALRPICEETAEEPPLPPEPVSGQETEAKTGTAEAKTVEETAPQPATRQQKSAPAAPEIPRNVLPPRSVPSDAETPPHSSPTNEIPERNSGPLEDSDRRDLYRPLAVLVCGD
jgi:hypothetical protein